MEGKRRKNGVKVTYLFPILLFLLSMVIPFSGLSPSLEIVNGATRGHTKGFGDEGNDTAVWGVISHIEGGIYANVLQNIDVEVVNYNVTQQNNVSLNFTVRNIDSGIYEGGTSGNTSMLLAPGTIDNHTLVWLPSGEGDYRIEISVINLDFIEDVVWNNDFTLNITIQNLTDIGVNIQNPADGNSYEESTMTVEVWVNNTGNDPVAQGFNLTLEVYNASTMVLDYSAVVVISSLDVQNPGSSYLQTFQWNPGSSGPFIINVNASLPTDSNPTNDLDSVSIVITPVSLRDFYVVVDPQEQYADPGSTSVPVTFTIVNNGTMADSYSYTITSGHNWIIPAGSNPTTGSTSTVLPGGSAIVMVSIQVPEGTGYDEMDRIRMNATSQANSSLRRSDSSWVYTYQNHEVNVTFLGAPQNGNPGEVLIYSFRIKNEGNIGESFYYRTNTLYGWVSYIQGESTPYYTGFLQPQAWEDIFVCVRIPRLVYETMDEDHTYGGATSDLTVTAEAINGYSDSSTVKTTVNYVAAASISSDPVWIEVAPLEVTQTVIFNLSVRNINNGREGGIINEDTIDMSVENYAFFAAWDNSEMDFERWNASLDISNTTVGGGEIDSDIKLAVFVPANPYNGSGYVRVRALPRGEGVSPGEIISDYVEVYIFVRQTASVGVVTDVPQEQTGAPLDALTYNFTLTNKGNGRDSFNVSISSEHGWTVEFVGTPVVSGLIPDANVTIEVQIIIPAYNSQTAEKDGTNVGDEDLLTMSIYSTFDMERSGSSNATTRVIQGYGVELTPDNSYSDVLPMGSVDYNITVTNLGNGKDVVSIVRNSALQDGWSVAYSPSTLNIEKGESANLIVTVTAGVLASVDENFYVQINGISQGDATKNDTANMTTNVSQTPGVKVEVITPVFLSGIPGEILAYSFSVENTGNGIDTFNLSASSGQGNWTITLSENQVTLPAFNSTAVTIQVFIPIIESGDGMAELREKNILAGNITKIRFIARSNYDNETSDSKTVDAQVEQVYDPSISALKTEEEVIPGKTAKYSITVNNMGNGQDNISFQNSETSPHSGYSVLSSYNVQLWPGNPVSIVLSVTPSQADMPILGEEYVNVISPLSGGNGQEGNSIIFTTTITFFDAIEGVTRNINVSTGNEVQSVLYTFYIMNIPDAQGNSASTDSFIITMDPWDMDLWDRGWECDLNYGNISNRTLLISLNGQYEETSFTMLLRSPTSTTEIGRDIVIGVVASSQSRSMERSIETTTRVVYVDIAFLGDMEFNSEEFAEGGELRITGTLLVQGTVPVAGLSVGLYINDELIDTHEISDRFELSETSSNMQHNFVFSWGLPKLDWNEKCAEYRIVLKVDESDAVYETSPVTSAEKNNVQTSTIWVKDDSLHSVICIIIILFSIGGAFYLYKGLDQNKYLYFFYGIFSGLLGASFFALPWDDLGLSGETANLIGNIIIWVTFLLLFTFVSLFVSLTSRSRIKNVMESKQKLDEVRFEPFKTMLEGEGEGKPKQKKRKNYLSLIGKSKFGPYIIAGAGAFIQVPLFFVVVTINSLSLSTLLYSLWGALYAFISIVCVYLLIRMDQSVYQHISNVEKIMDQMREDALKRIDMESILEGSKNEGGGQPVK